MPDLIGTTLGRYQVHNVLGEGGMATVYKALDTYLERYVAIKVIRRQAFSPEVVDKMLLRFEREAKALARLAHPNIVHIHDFGEYEGSPYLVMEYIPGGTLKDRTGQKMPAAAAARLLLPVAKALDYAHHKGIIHRDVKPGNILLTEEGEPTLSDFGIAKILENEDGATLTGTGVGIGTPEYMSPEQGLGRQVDFRTDIYALGVIFYELVTGRKPYTGNTPMEIVVKHLNEPLPNLRQFIPDLPDTVEEVIQKALAKQPQDRFPSMEAMAKALEACTHPEVTTSPTITPEYTADSTRIRAPILQPIPVEEATITREPIAQVEKDTRRDTVKYLKPSSAFWFLWVIFSLSAGIIATICSLLFSPWRALILK
ncbi:MAG TPA: serine/threonine-protein kinase [Anaerolineaceae bacterium]